MARPAFKATDERRKTVQALASYGVIETEIALVLDCDPKTLRKYFREELDTAHIRATAKVAESLFKMATTGNVAAAIFWMKARAGWSEKFIHAGDDNSPLRVEVVRFTPDQAPE